MKFEDLEETCNLENKQTPPIDPNAAMLNDIADKVEAVISSRLEEFNKKVNPVDNPPINNNGDAAGNNDNAGDSSGNNDGANGSAEQE